MSLKEKAFSAIVEQTENTQTNDLVVKLSDAQAEIDQKDRTIKSMKKLTDAATEIREERIKSLGSQVEGLRRKELVDFGFWVIKDGHDYELLESVENTIDEYLKSK